MDETLNIRGSRLARELGTKKHKATIRLAEEPSTRVAPPRWEGGSCFWWALLGLEEFTLADVVYPPQPPWPGRPVAAEVQLRPGVALLCRGTFCGKPAEPLLIVSTLEDVQRLRKLARER